MPSSSDIIVEKKKVTERKFKEPGKFKVVVCNDDVTPMDFVVAMLVTIFNHNEKNAVTITNMIHHQGSGIAGVYRYEIAEQKALDGINLARTHGWPLIIKVEEE